MSDRLEELEERREQRIDAAVKALDSAREWVFDDLDLAVEEARQAARELERAADSQADIDNYDEEE